MEDFSPSEEEPKAEMKKDDDDEADLVGLFHACIRCCLVKQTDFLVVYNIISFQLTFIAFDNRGYALMSLSHKRMPKQRNRDHNMQLIA